jgi:fatty acid desaturase
MTIASDSTGGGPAGGTADAPKRVPNYVRHAAEIRRRIQPFVAPEDLKRVQQRSAIRHFLVAGRHVLMTVLCVVLAIRYENPWIWVPVAALQGVNLLGFIILLHDAIHQAIFVKSRKGLSYFFALLYMLPSSISASQFERWHLDHHAELGTEDEDPKRRYLTPKIVTRLFKALYMTPALFVIYSIASQKAAKRYPAALRRRIALEKAFAIGLHLVAIAALWRIGGFEFAARVHLVPFFIMFPIAFTINRAGQHYDIDPTDPAKWSTLVPGDPITNFFFLNSNYHIEHHYFPRVPLYNLPELHRLLIPFFEHIDHHPKTYPEILWGWFVLNKDPHTNWDQMEEFVEP